MWNSPYDHSATSDLLRWPCAGTEVHWIDLTLAAPSMELLIPHGPANVSWRGDCAHCTQVSQLAYSVTFLLPHRLAEAGWAVIVLISHGPAEAVLYLYHTAQPRSFTHHSLYHIYHLPIWVMHLNTFDIEHSIDVQDSFFNMNSMVIFVLWLDYLIWWLLQEFLIWSILYMFRTHFSIQIQSLLHPRNLDWNYNIFQNSEPELWVIYLICLRTIFMPTDYYYAYVFSRPHAYLPT